MLGSCGQMPTGNLVWAWRELQLGPASHGDTPGRQGCPAGQGNRAGESPLQSVMCWEDSGQALGTAVNSIQMFLHREAEMDMVLGG